VKRHEVKSSLYYQKLSNKDIKALETYN